MFSLRDYIKVLDRMKKVGEDLLDIDKESGGLFQKMFSKGEGFVPNVLEGGVGFQPEVDLLGGQLGASGIGMKPDLIGGLKTSFQGPQFNVGKMVEGAGRATPFKTLFEQLGQFGQGRVDEEFQQSMMMPQLIQMLMGQIGGR